jgi:thiol:disulfide interchange protein DsbC
VKDVRGNGARTLAIFSDPDCPYCRKLEAEIKSLTDITIYTFLMPIASLHPGARSKAIAVWCSRDRVGAWRALMLHDMQPDDASPARECPHPVDRNIALGERLGINGTPTLVAGDGRILPGAASRAQIEAWLARATASAEGPASRATGAAR